MLPCEYCPAGMEAARGQPETPVIPTPEPDPKRDKAPAKTKEEAPTIAKPKKPQYNCPYIQGACTTCGKEGSILKQNRICRSCDRKTWPNQKAPKKALKSEPTPPPGSIVVLPPSARIPTNAVISSAQLIDLHFRLCEEARGLMERKNSDYKAGSGDPFANFRMAALLHIRAEMGAMLRMQDKMARLLSFMERGTLAVKEESWHDCILDLINYSVIIHGLLDEVVARS